MDTQTATPLLNRSFKVQFNLKGLPGVPMTTIVEAQDDEDRTLIAAINQKLPAGAVANRIVLVMEQV